MAETSERHRSEFRESLHELNQRYKQAWDRAERLQDELDHIKNSRAYRFVCWLKRISGLWKGARRCVPSRRLSPEFASEFLDHDLASPIGSVTILIPFKDHLDLLRNCIRSIRHSSYRDVEIVLLDNGSTCPRTLRYLAKGQAHDHFKVIPCPGPFNFSRVCNLGARRASGAFLLFLNNDTEVMNRDWLDHLLQLGNHESVGIVGATLLYPDRTLQHVGVFPDEGGGWTHKYRGFPADYSGEFDELMHPRTVPAVTGACLMIRRSLFTELGGFNEAYPLTFNDIDLCRRVWQRGLRVAITPHARLWHFESLSRGYSRELLTLP